MLTISTRLDGFEGISDVCLAMPTVVGRGGALRTLHPRLSASELHGLRTSAASVREVAKKFGF